MICDAGVPPRNFSVSQLAIGMTSHFSQLFRITDSPGLVVPGLGRAIDAPQHVPALAGNGLEPVGFLAGRRLGAEVDVVGTVLVLDQVLLVAVDSRELLIGLQFGAGLVVIERERPEGFHRHIRRHMHLVGLAAIERVALGIHVGHGIDRTLAIRRLGHRGRDPRRVEVEVGAGIEVAGIVLVEEQIAATDKWRRPHSFAGVVIEHVFTWA